jgi:DNA-directed RNA polymerase specialized sigma24 family protein
MEKRLKNKYRFIKKVEKEYLYLFQKNKDLIHNVIYNIVNNEEDTEDIMQNIHLYLISRIRGRDKYKEIDKLQIGLIVKCSKNRTIDFLRKKKRRIKTTEFNENLKHKYRF